METWQVAIVSSLLTLIGTLAVAWLGYRQWKHGRQSEHRKSYDIERIAKYRELWGLVEDTHVRIRTALPSKDELRKLDQTLNTFRLRNSIYIDTDTLELSNDYFNATKALYLFLVENELLEGLEKFEITVIGGALEGARELEQVMLEKRAALIAKIKAALNADAV